eukprot:COSAG02_NODE_1275_length_13506_cov_8.845603_18_plen_1068_part_00
MPVRANASSPVYMPLPDGVGAIASRGAPEEVEADDSGSSRSAPKSFSSAGWMRQLLKCIGGVHTDPIRSACFSPDGKTLCLASWDKTASLIDVSTGAAVRKIEGVHTDGIWSASFSPDGKTLCLASEDKTASLIYVSTGAVVRKIEGVHTGSIFSACFSPDGKTLCLASGDSTASLIEVSTGAVVRKIEGVHTERIRSACFSPDGKTLCLVFADKTVSLIEVSTGAVVRKIEGVHTDGICSACFSPDGKTLCLASWDKTASLIEVSTGAVVRKIEGVHTDGIVSACFSPDGKTLCLASEDETASLIEVSTGAVVRKIEGVHTGSIVSACFSPDGKTLCLASGDKTASLIDVSTGAVVRKIEGVHTAIICSACFSPDGKTLCLASWDKTATLVDLSWLSLLRDGIVLPRWVDIAISAHCAWACRCTAAQLTQILHCLVPVYPEIALMDGAVLLRHTVQTRNLESFTLLAAAIDQTDAKAIPLYPDETGRSIVRLAIEQDPPIREVVERLFAMYATKVGTPDGYSYAVHFEAAPTLKDDLLYIMRHAKSCVEPAVDLLKNSGLVMAPRDYQAGPLRIQRPLFRPRGLVGAYPFAGVQDINVDDTQAPQIETEIMALSIPGACQPGKDPTDGSVKQTDSKSIKGDLLFDSIAQLRNYRAMDTETLRTLVPFWWDEVGRQYAAREAIIYLISFLVPLSLLCISLAGLHTQDAADTFTTTTKVAAGLCTIWTVRQVWHECLQWSARRACDYYGDFWNVVDLLLLGLWVAMFALFFAPQLFWWCKQVAAAAVLLAYMKVAHFAQGLPGLGRLVQLVISVVSAMRDFLVLFGLTIVGLSLAFMLVFSVAPTSSSGAMNHGGRNDSMASDEPRVNDSIEFGSVPISLFRSFTTIVGDFDVQTLWQRGSPAVAVFVSAVLFGNIVMLNLLIAIVSDEFEQFMERAHLEAQLALATICEEARCVRRINHKNRPELFERHLFVLRPKARKKSLSTDTWAGKANAIAKRLGGVEITVEHKLTQVKEDLGATLDKKLCKFEVKMDEKICGLEAKMQGLESKVDANFTKMFNALERFGGSD